MNTNKPKEKRGFASAEAIWLGVFRRVCKLNECINCLRNYIPRQSLVLILGYVLISQSSKMLTEPHEFWNGSKVSSHLGSLTVKLVNQTGITVEQFPKGVNVFWIIRNALYPGTQLGKVSSKLSLALFAISSSLSPSSGNRSNDGSHSSTAKNASEDRYSLRVYIHAFLRGLLWGSLGGAIGASVVLWLTRPNTKLTDAGPVTPDVS